MFFLLLFIFFLLAQPAKAQVRSTEYCVTVSNPGSSDRCDVPVVMSLPQDWRVRSATVTCGTERLPWQMDDLDGDGRNDELCFLTHLKGGERRTFSVRLSAEESRDAFPSRVYAEMIVPDKKVKEKNRQHYFITDITVRGDVPSYQMLHHHGVAFESELVAMRIYYDERQTVDLYGKRNERLELAETQFYPSAEQLAEGYGDDILRVGNTVGLGAMRGWNGSSETMISPVEGRRQHIVANGPLRTIVEVSDIGWRTSPDALPVNMTTRYTLYAGHRDCQVDVRWDEVPDQELFATGITLINHPQTFNQSSEGGSTLRACWGTDWPVAEKDSAGHQRETVGMAIRIPYYYVEAQPEATASQHLVVVKPVANSLHYDIAFGSDKETFGYHSASEWFDFVRRWDEELRLPVVIASVGD